MILLPTITDFIHTPYWSTYPLAADAHECLDDDNGDTSYCWSSSHLRHMILGFANPSVVEGDIDTITSVRFLSSGRSTDRRNASLLNIEYETPSGNPIETCSYDPHASSYETINGTARSDADGSSGGWSYADLENLEMRCTKNGIRLLRLSYLAMEVTYTEAVSADNATFFGANF
jgi:hypothetical protein